MQSACWMKNQGLLFKTAEGDVEGKFWDRHNCDLTSSFPFRLQKPPLALSLPHTETVSKHEASAAAWLTHYRPRGTGEADVINNSHQQKNKTGGKKKRPWSLTWQVRKKSRCLFRHGYVALFNLMRGSAKSISRGQVSLDFVALEVFRAQSPASCSSGRVASDAIGCHVYSRKMWRMPSAAPVTEEEMFLQI